MYIEDKSLEKQRDILEERGIIFGNKEDAINKLKYINYYKIKEYSYPFIIQKGSKEIKYSNVEFRTIINRYYQDSRMRVNLLECLEMIEIALKTVFARELGKNSPYQYLEFSKWCNKEEYCRHYLGEKQSDLKRLIEKRTLDKRLLTKEIEYFWKFNEDQKPKVPIWMLVEMLTLGEIVYLMNLMSKNRRANIANELNVSNDDLLSWIKFLKFIRNQVAHNHNIIDLKLKSKPKVKEEWKKYLYRDTEEKITSNRLSVIVIIVVNLVLKINPTYKFNRFQRNLNDLIKTEQDAQYYGFRDSKTARNIINLMGGSFKKINKSSIKNKDILKILENSNDIVFLNQVSDILNSKNQ